MHHTIYKLNEMKQWLREKGFEFADNILKVELYDIKMHKLTFKIYEVDEILQKEGYSETPPYQPDLNSIESF